MRVVARVHTIHAKGMRSYEGFRLSCVLCTLLFAVHGDACLGGVRSHRRKRRVRQDDPLSRQRRLGRSRSRTYGDGVALRVLAANGWRTTATAGIALP